MHIREKSCFVLVSLVSQIFFEFQLCTRHLAPSYFPSHFFYLNSLETDLIDTQGEVIFYLITFIFSKLLETLEALSFLIKPIFAILQC